MTSRLSDQYLILLYEYEISIALLGYALFLVTSALSVKYYRLDVPHKISCWVTMLFGLLQTGCCFYWWKHANVLEYYTTLDLLTHPVQFYFSLFCNPIAPLLVLWFYRCHLLELTVSTACTVYRTFSLKIAASLTLGAVCGFLGDLFLVQQGIEASMGWKILFGMSCAASWLEISIRRLESQPVLIIYSFFWYIGAWLYFFSKI